MRPVLLVAAATVLVATAPAPAPAPAEAPHAAAPAGHGAQAADTAPPDPGKVDTDADAAQPAMTGAPGRAVHALPHFAPQFSARPVIASPAGWRTQSHGGDWAALVHATPETRQAARWDYARARVGQGRAAEAIGALTVMQQDEPDLALVPSFQLALGAAYALLDRAPEALAALSADALATNPEACLWRMFALAESEAPAQALGQVNCAIPALNARSGEARAPFLVAAARAAFGNGQPALTLQLLKTAPEMDPAVVVLRGRAELALNRLDEGRALLTRMVKSPDPEAHLDAELALIEDNTRRGAIPPAAAARLRQIRYIWRGGDVELRALQLSYRLAREAHDLRGTLEAGATLFRYFTGGPDRATLVPELQQALAAAMAPENPMPLDQVAGLYWDYRDLSPAAAEGDLLVSQFADRLQGAGLYGRAAELLEYQLLVRTRDIAQGPLSARVASLFVLAGEPARALAAIRNTDGNNYPAEMLWDRHRVEAVALDQIGRTDEAMAALQDVPDGPAIVSEIYWKRRNWPALVAVTAPTLGGKEPLTEVMQAKILRYAIALAMLGREDALARLRSQYGAQFAKLPTAAAFAALTAEVDTIDPTTVIATMAAIPTASPAGEIGTLMDIAPPVAAKQGA